MHNLLVARSIERGRRSGGGERRGCNVCGSRAHAADCSGASPPPDRLTTNRMNGNEVAGDDHRPPSTHHRRARQVFLVIDNVCVARPADASFITMQRRR
ncbi:unnamed protein product [Danaus chrysippus]|uniref:(African queen) hypothetical protein n=1 Tax=Danaus chrysippus TaxID=151541 RepID=A0A8J2QEU7_9NEOP|nr:unnamed protein product [Danaus chrysippus]